MHHVVFSQTPPPRRSAAVLRRRITFFSGFAHVLQMNCNSAWRDHRYRSIDIKCIQAWTSEQKARRTEKKKKR